MIGEIIKEIRTSKRITLKEVYIKTGISDSRLHRFENGKSKALSLDELKTLIEFYGVSLDYLLCSAGYIKRQDNVFNSTDLLDENDIIHIQNEIDMIVELKGGRK